MFSQPAPPSRTVLTKVAGVEMSTVVMGEGKQVGAPVFVLVHGLGMSHRYMMPTARLLAAMGEVYVPDLPGFGDSGKDVKVLTIPELSDALMEWMESIGLERVILLGNSLGGQVLIDFATRHARVAAAVILVGPTIDPEARRLSSQLLRLLHDIFLEPWDLYWIGLTDYLRAGLRRNVRTLRDALGDPILEKLPLIRCPVLIVRGGRDPIVPERWVERAARLIPDSRLVTIPGAGHAVNFNAPEQLVAEVAHFLSSRPGLRACCPSFFKKAGIPHGPEVSLRKALQRRQLFADGFSLGNPAFQTHHRDELDEKA